MHMSLGYDTSPKYLSTWYFNVDHHCQKSWRFGKTPVGPAVGIQCWVIYKRLVGCAKYMLWFPGIAIISKESFKYGIASNIG